MQQKFRMTLWFKKGALDAEQAELAAHSGDDLHPGALDLLPAEDRYLDNGSVTGDDVRDYSLRTGSTTYMPKIGVHEGGTVASTGEDIGPMVREMKRGRRVALALIGAAATAVAGAMVVLYAL